MTLSTSFGDPNEEPIPDFGPEGPVGFESGDLKQNRATPGQCQMQARGMGRQIQILRMTLSKLEITNEQNSEIKAVFEKYTDEGMELRKEVTRLQDTFKAVRSGTGNEGATKEIRTELAAYAEKSQNLQSEFRQSLMEVLTFQQKAKFYQIQEQMRQRANSRSKT